jgi:hypothetical protein
MVACSSSSATGIQDSGEQTGGKTDAAADEARSEARDLGSSSDLIFDEPWVAWLDACFEGLPAPVGLQVSAQKSSSDGATHVRMALDTMGKTGLAYPWSMVRLGVVMGEAVICVTEKRDLTYTVTHHNCSDVASAVAGATRFEIVSPGDSSTELRIFSGSTLVDTISLTTESCIRSDGPGACPLIGPC